MSQVLELLGKLHPVLLHFPLALLVLAGCFELIALVSPSAFTARTVTWLVATGFVFAVLSAWSGWVLAAHEHFRSDQRLTLERHRWLGIATVLAAGLSCATSTLSFRSAAYLRRGFTISTALVALAAGYFGGELVWGKDWLRSEEHSHE